MLKFQFGSFDKVEVSQWLQHLLKLFSKPLEALHGLEEMGRTLEALPVTDAHQLFKPLDMRAALSELNDFMHDAQDGVTSASAEVSIDWKVETTFPATTHALTLQRPRIVFSHLRSPVDSMIVNESLLELRPTRYGWEVEVQLDDATHDVARFTSEMRRAPGFAEVARPVAA